MPSPVVLFLSAGRVTVPPLLYWMSPLCAVASTGASAREAVSCLWREASPQGDQGSPATLPSDCSGGSREHSEQWRPHCHTQAPSEQTRDTATSWTAATSPLPSSLSVSALSPIPWLKFHGSLNSCWPPVRSINQSSNCLFPLQSISEISLCSPLCRCFLIRALSSQWDLEEASSWVPLLPAPLPGIHSLTAVRISLLKWKLDYPNRPKRSWNRLVITFA